MYVENQAVFNAPLPADLPPRPSPGASAGPPQEPKTETPPPGPLSRFGQAFIGGLVATTRQLIGADGGENLLRGWATEAWGLARKQAAEVVAVAILRGVGLALAAAMDGITDALKTDTNTDTK